MKEPYQINVDASILDDLQYRLARTRWPNEVENENWQAGTNSIYLKELCNYWWRDFDWRKQESLLNSFSNYKAQTDGTGIHFIHEKGKGGHSVPLLLIHGFPDSFVRFLKVIPLLTEADEDGFSFDVVVPSIPGFGFSDIPVQAGMNAQYISSLFTKLMTDELGYSHFIVQGGDWGSTIAEHIAIHNPQFLEGMHLTDVPWYHLFAVPDEDIGKTEKEYMQRGQAWSQKEGAYALIQSTKPQSLSYGMNDSPSGLAAWIIGKFYNWSDCNSKLENCYTKDELLTNLTIYWATQTINSAMRIYYETARVMPKQLQQKIERPTVPVGIALFPHDLVNAPREFADRIFNVQQWTEMPKGGHFAAMEQPELFAADVRKFGKTLKGVIVEENVIHSRTDLL